MIKREPSLNSYRPKEVVVQASDCMIYINGVNEFYMCHGEGGKDRFTDALVSVSTSLSTEASPGSASITLAVPRHSNNTYFKFGRCVFKPMMEVQIFFKGRFLDDQKRPVYYPAFWGVITGVNAPYSSGENTISLTCKDILYFWQITRLGTNPNIFQQIWDNKLKIQEYVNIFNHMSPYQIIIALARVLHGSLIPPQNFPNLGSGSSKISLATFNEENEAATEYWRKRQMGIGQKLRIFGAAPGNGEGSISGTVSSIDEAAIDKEAAKFDYLAKGGIPKGVTLEKDLQSLFTTTKTTYEEPFALDGRLMDHFQPYNQANQVSDFSSGESMSRMEIANQVKEFIDYEFFMDTTGELVFKPPFYNIDVREHDPISIIRDRDVFSDDVGENIEEIITRLDVKGTYSNYYEGGSPNQIPWSSYVDYRMAREYGEKFQEVTRNYLHTPEMCTLYAIAELSKFNAKRFSGTIEIIGRPELRLGYPIYYESKDTFYYVTGIAHTYSSNGVLKTTLSVEGARRKYTSPDPDKKEGYSWDVSDPLRPKLKGVANVVLTMDIPQSVKEAKPVKPGEVNTTVKKEDTTPTVNNKVNQQTKPNNTAPPPKKDPKPGATSKVIQTKPEDNPYALYSDIYSLLPGGSILALQQQIQEKQGTEKVNVKDLTKDPSTLYIPEFAVYKSPHIELIDRVMEGAVGIKFQAYGRPKEIVQKGVYVATLRQIPVSDEFGYEVIGGFGYGRGTKVNSDGLLRTYLPRSEAIKVSDAQLKKLRESGNKDIASVIYRINGTPDLDVSNLSNSYRSKDYVSRHLGRSKGDGGPAGGPKSEFIYSDVGKYLSEMGKDLEHRMEPLGMNECVLAETDGAILAMYDAEGAKANSYMFKAEYYGMLADNVPSTAFLGDEVLPGIKRDVGGSEQPEGGGVPGGGTYGPGGATGYSGQGSPIYFAQIEMGKGVKEEPKGSNQGPIVNLYTKSVGLTPNLEAYWCGAFVFWCFDASAKSRGVTNPVPTLVRYVPGFWKWARSKGWEVKDPAPGDIFTYPAGVNCRHTGLVASVNAAGIVTIEGNTSDKVTSLSRPKNSCSYFRVPNFTVPPVGPGLPPVKSQLASGKESTT